MSEDIMNELHRGLPHKEGRLEYTRRAFRLLPPMDAPRILDMGCGRGDPTIELARLSGGRVTGVDIDQVSLDELATTARKEGLADRVKALRMDIKELKFPDASFEIIWAEGSMWIIGLEKGLREHKQLLSPGGCFVIHEMCWLRPDPPEEIRERWTFVGPGIRTVEENLELLPRCGYSLLGHFTLPEDIWWEIYFVPVKERIEAMRERYADVPEALEVLDREQTDVDLYRRYSSWYGSAFFVLQKD